MDFIPSIVLNKNNFTLRFIIKVKFVQFIKANFELFVMKLSFVLHKRKFLNVFLGYYFFPLKIKFTGIFQRGIVCAALD